MEETANRRNWRRIEREGLCTDCDAVSVLPGGFSFAATGTAAAVESRMGYDWLMIVCLRFLMRRYACMDSFILMIFHILVPPRVLLSG